MKQLIKDYLIKNNRTYWYVLPFVRLIHRFFNKEGNLSITNEGLYKIRKQVQGVSNHLIIGKGCILNNVVIHIRGNNNTIEFDENVKVGKGCSFWCEGNNCEIFIGKGTTFTQKVHFNCQEDNSRIECGEDCMFSNNIIVRTSDSHAILDIKTMERINPAKDITIGNHVWIAPKSMIMKGVKIGHNVIIGSNTIVTKDIPNNVLAVGMPAKIVKEGVTWSRKDIIFNK